MKGKLGQFCKYDGVVRVAADDGQKDDWLALCTQCLPHHNHTSTILEPHHHHTSTILVPHHHHTTLHTTPTKSTHKPHQHSVISQATKSVPFSVGCPPPLRANSFWLSKIPISCPTPARLENSESSGFKQNSKWAQRRLCRKQRRVTLSFLLSTSLFAWLGPA